MNSNINDFNHDFDNFTIVSKQINEFTLSDKLHKLQVFDSEVEAMSKSVKEKAHELQAIEPELASLKAKVGDQD